MAGENNEDLIREQIEDSRQQREELAALRRQMAQLTNAFSRTLTEEQKRESSIQGVVSQFNEFGNALESENPMIRARAKILDDEKKALENLTSSIQQASAAFKDGFKNLISQSDRSFGKYNGAIEGMADAAAKVAGPVFGAFISAAGKVTGAMLAQYDAFLKTTDSISKFGGTVGMTTSEFRDLAHNAGVTSKNLDVLARPLKDLGINLTSLASNATDGTREFAKLTAISSEQRMSYQRLGVSQEELIKNQADYLTLQAVAGRNIKAEIKDRATLQRETLEYTDSLMTLANLTGQDVDVIKKKQQEASRAVEWQIGQINLENRARELEGQGRKEEAAKLREQAKNQQKVLDTVTGFGNEVVTKGVRQMMATGTVAGEEAAALARMGLLEDVQQLQKAVKNGMSAQEAAAKFQDAYNKKFGETIKNVGTAAQFSKDAAKAYGISEDSLQNYNKQRDQNAKEELKTAKERIEAQKKAGFDTPKDARALLTEAEIAAGKAVDALTGSALGAAVAIAGLGAASVLKGFKLDNIAERIKGVDKLIGGLGRGAAAAGAPIATTVATTAAGAAAPAAAAATTAATAAGAAAAPAAATAATAAGASTAAGAATTAAGALAKLAGPLSKLSSAAPAIGAVVSVGEGVVDAYQGIRKAEKDLESGKITKEEARTQKGEAAGGGVGTAIGGTAGALKGAAIGASIGSVVPVLGTAVGGILGAALGGWMGANAGKAIGEVAGGGIAKMTADSDKEVEKAKKKAEEKEKQQDFAKEKLKDAKYSDVVKVQIVNPVPLPVSIVQDKDKKDEPRLELAKDKDKKEEITKVSITNPIPVPVSIIKGLEPLASLASVKPEQREKSKNTIETTTMLAGALLGPVGLLLGKGIGSILEKQPKPIESKKPETVEAKLDTDYEKLVAQRDKIEKTGPVTDSAQSKLAHERLLRTLDKAIAEKEKEKQVVVKKEKLDLPQASTGGSFSGPKEGYPVMLHGDEDVVPKKTNVVKKPLDLENIGQTTKTIVEKPKEIVRETVANVTGMEMAGDLAGNVAEKVLKKVSPDFAKIQALSNTIQTAGKIENKITGDSEPLDKIMEIARIIPKTGTLLDKIEGVQRIFSNETTAAEKLWETAKLLNPTVRVLSAVIDVAKPFMQQPKQSITEEKTDVVQSLDEVLEAIDTEEVSESNEKLSVTFNSSDKALTALTGNILRYNKVVEETLNDNEDEITGEIKSDLKHVAVGVNKDFQNSFKGAYTQLEDFKRKFVEVTDTAMQGGTGKPEPVRSGTGEIVRDSSGQPVVTRPEAPLPVKQDAKENLAEIKKVLMAKGEKDQNYINAVLANILKETGGKRVEENLNYGKTSNERIRSIFGERAAGKSDAELSAIKSNPQQMGEMMYGSTTKIGQSMGNKEPGDGWKYRGRGYIQLTGKNNYAEASKAIFGDDTLVRNPDLVNDPRYASEIVAWFMEKSKKGMAKTLGINTGAMSQDQANLLATSQIAGKAITPGKGYLGGELLGKVSGYTQSIAKSDIGGASPGGVQVAAANQESSKPLSGSHAGETSGGQQRDTSKISTKDPREQIEQAGLKVRPYGDVYEGGPLTDSALALAKTLQDNVPNFMFYTGLNDKFHQQKHPRSKHAIGQGLDFVLSKGPSPEESQEIKALIQKMPGVSLVKNEYYPPPAGDANQNTTGPHFHVQTSAKDGAEIDGPEAGYPVDLTAHGREVIAPLDPTKVLGMLADLNATPQTKEMFTGIAGNEVSGNSQLMDSVLQYMKTQNQMMELMAEKLDSIVEELEESNNTQGDLLKATRV